MWLLGATLLVLAFFLIRYFTQKNKSQRFLRESEERYRDIGDNIPGFIYQFVRQSDGTYRFPFVSKSADKILMVSAEDVMRDAASAFQKVVPEDLQPLIDSIENSAAKMIPWQHDFRTLRNGSGVRYLRGSSVPRKQSDGSILWNGVVLDITEQKKVEQELKKKTQALERSNKELEQFAFVASHDLQEPLRKIIAFGELLREAIATEPGESQEYLARMQAASNRMKQLIEDLLALSRVTTREQVFQPIDLSDLIPEVIEDLETGWKDSKITLELNKLPRVMGDWVQIRQLFQNLISNGLKFQPEGVSPQVWVRGKDSANGWVEIAVEDNGIGFDARDHQRIFDPFQRLHSMGKFDGSGMGLAICKKIVDRHGGEIYAKSEPGKGSVFTVLLPRAS